MSIFTNYSFNNDEFDITKLLKLFYRNKKTIYLFGLIFFLISLFSSFGLKKKWEGEFQIVLDLKDGNSFNIDPALAGILDIQKQSANDLKTEVGILRSPSVLMPIFNFVNNQHLKENPEKKPLKYKNWEKNLFIDLEKNTSILNISYIDKRKDIIVPVLKKISETYQEYSGRSKARDIKLTKNFLKGQIDIFKLKSSNSIRAAQEFGIEQDLIIPNESRLDSRSLLPVDKGFTTIKNIDIEQLRVEAANEIRMIDIQILKIKKLGDDPKQVQYIASTIPALVDEGLPDALKNLEQELVEQSIKYTDEDRTIKSIIEKQELLINLIKERSLGYLKARKVILQSKLESVMRPKGVLLKYKELIRDAARDEETLISLENQFNKIKLEEAKLNDPWQLITEPTLMDIPVSISKKKVIFLSSIVGIIFGFLYSFL